MLPLLPDWRRIHSICVVVSDTSTRRLPVASTPAVADTAPAGWLALTPVSDVSVPVGCV